MYDAFDGDLQVNLDQGCGDRRRRRQLKLDGGEEALGAGGVVDQVEVGAGQGEGLLDGLGLQQECAVRGTLALQ